MGTWIVYMGGEMDTDRTATHTLATETKSLHMTNPTIVFGYGTTKDGLDNLACPDRKNT